MIAGTKIHIVSGLWFKFIIFTIESGSIVSWSESKHKILRIDQCF